MNFASIASSTTACQGSITIMNKKGDNGSRCRRLPLTNTEAFEETKAPRIHDTHLGPKPRMIIICYKNVKLTEL